MIIVIAFLLLFLYDKKLAFNIFIFYSIFDPGFPIVRGFVNFILSDLVLCIFLIDVIKDKYLISNFKKYIPKFLIVFFLGYHLLTCLMQEPSHIMYYILVVVRTLGVFLVFINYVKTEQQLLNFAKVLICAIILQFSYSLIEAVLTINPIADYFDKITGSTFSELSDIRYGLNRAQASLRHATTNSYVALIFMSILSILFNLGLGNRKKYTVLAYCCLGTIFFTGVRSIIISGLIVLISFINLRKTRKIFPVLIVGCVVLYFIPQDYLTEIYESYTDTESVSGSSTDMRLLQFLKSFSIMQQSIVWGLGANSFSLYKDFIFGAESVWFQLMIDFGTMGVLFYLCLIIRCLKEGILLFKQTHEIYLLLIFIALFITNSMTSLPGYNPTTYTVGVLFLISLIYKKAKKYKQ